MFVTRYLIYHLSLITYRLSLITDTMEAAMSKKLASLDYKDAYFLRKFLNSQGKMYPPKRHGLSAKEQRALARAIKRARFMALIPYLVR